MTNVEKTPQFMEYAKLSAKNRIKRTDLLSQALVQAYIQIDEDLRELEEGGLMVSIKSYFLMRLCLK